MTDLSKTILADYQVRKTKKQKTAFIDFLCAQIPGLQVEHGGFGNNRNLVLGDVNTAKVIFGAHYDTCAKLFIPNFITPKNIPLYIGYSLLLCIPFGIIAGLINGLLHMVTDSFFITYWGTFLPTMALIFWMFMGGKPNPNTANDNTSGVITLCELIAAMTEEEKSKVAFVFFDNEENGLLGSSWFVKHHKKDDLKNKLMINFDCVSDGDHILFVQNKPALKTYGDALKSAFPNADGKTVYLESASNTMYPSDQGNFPMSVGVAALKKKKFIGLYMDRIHTPKDTVFEEENITFLVNGAKRMMNTIL